MPLTSTSESTSAITLSFGLGRVLQQWLHAFADPGLFAHTLLLPSSDRVNLLQVTRLAELVSLILMWEVAPQWAGSKGPHAAAERGHALKQIQDLLKETAPETPASAAAVVAIGSREDLLISRELTRALHVLAQDYAYPHLYTAGRRTGGVLKGCPRSPPPSPTQLAMPFNLMLMRLEHESCGQGLLMPLAPGERRRRSSENPRTQAEVTVELEALITRLWEWEALRDARDQEQARERAQLEAGFAWLSEQSATNLGARAVKEELLRLRALERSAS